MRIHFLRARKAAIVNLCRMVLTFRLSAGVNAVAVIFQRQPGGWCKQASRRGKVLSVQEIPAWAGGGQARAKCPVWIWQNVFLPFPAMRAAGFPACG